MIEENGHKWVEGHNNDRCLRCAMSLAYYYDIRHASEEQPEREDLKEWLRCKKGGLLDITPKTTRMRVVLKLYANDDK